MNKVKEGYKMTELGEIPVEWECKKLDEITNITRLAGAEYSDVWKTDKNGKIIALKGNNIGENKLILNYTEKITEEMSNRLIRSKLFKNDIVFPCVGTIGKATLINQDNKYHINQNIAKITPQECIYPLYLTYFLMSKFTYNQIQKYNTSSSQPNVLVGNLRRFNINIPLLKEQEKISLILSSVDEQIEITDNLIEKTKELKKGLMQKLLTKGIRHERFNETEIGRMPKAWEVKTMKDIINSTQLGTNTLGKEYVSNGIPMIKMGNMIIGGFNFDKIEYIENKELETNKEFILNKGDFLFNTRNTLELVGKSATWNSQVPLAIFNSNIMRIEYKSNVDSFYMSYYFEDSAGWKLLKSIATGTTSVGAIYTKDLIKVKVKLPNLDEQKQIASILFSVDEKIEQYELKKEKLQEIKKGLMQKLLTGKIRVKV